MRDLLAITLRQHRYDVAVAEGGEAAVAALKAGSFDLVITDLRMRQLDGLAVLKAAKELSPETVVLVVTAFASTETAVEAMKLGAYDYITKPFKLEEIWLTVDKALERKRLQDENVALKRQLRKHQASKYIQQALYRTGGNQTRAAALLGLSFRQLRYKVRKHGLQTDHPPHPREAHRRRYRTETSDTVPLTRFVTPCQLRASLGPRPTAG